MPSKIVKIITPIFVISAENMSILRPYVTRDPTPEDSEPQGAEMVQVCRGDMRYLIDDTMNYPHMAIAFMQMQFPSEDDDDEFGEEYAGTGFLCDDHMFLTACHNVLKIDDDNNRIPATTISLMFGLNGSHDFRVKKSFALEGCDFVVPKEHQKASDEHDVAVLNLQEFHHRKQSEGIKLDWTRGDLPTKTFYSYDIPEQHGALEGKYTICGNSYIFLKYNYTL